MEMLPCFIPLSDQSVSLLPFPPAYTVSFPKQEPNLAATRDRLETKIKIRQRLRQPCADCAMTSTVRRQLQKTTSSWTINHTNYHGRKLLQVSFLSPQNFCHDKHVCHDKRMLKQTSFCFDKSSVMTKDVLCHDKHMFAVTNMFVATKMILANDI